VFGFGRIDITVMASVDGEPPFTGESEAFVFGFIVLQLPEKLADFFDRRGDG